MIFDNFTTILTPEQRLFGQILGTDWSAGAKRVWPPLDESIDWKIVPDLAWQYKMRPMVAAAVHEASWGVPAQVRESLESSSRECTLKTVRQIAVLNKIMGAAEARGFRFIAMKGLALSACFYGDPFIREAYDLDILVSRPDFKPFVELLSGLGFRSIHSDSPLSNRQEAILACFRHDNKMVHSQTGAVIDVHYRLDYNQYRLNTDFEAIWQERSHTQIGPHSLPIPGPRDLMRFTTIHAARHGWERWKWLGDLAVLFRRASPEELAQDRQAARRDGFLDAFDCSLLLIHSVTGWRLPAGIAEPVRANRRARRFAAQALQFSAPGLKPAEVGQPESLGKVSRQLLWNNWRGIAFELLRLMHREHDWRALRLPDYLIPAYYFFRFFGLVERRVARTATQGVKSA